MGAAGAYRSGAPSSLSRIATARPGPTRVGPGPRVSHVSVTVVSVDQAMTMDRVRETTMGRRAQLKGFLCAAICVTACGAAEHDIATDRAGGGQILLAKAMMARPASPHIAHSIERLESARPVWQVGSVDGSPETQWGFVTDATSDSSGRLYVLDQMNATIRVFSPDGRHITSMFRDGDGPLEMRQPMGVEMLPGDSLLVYSTSSTRIVALQRSGSPLQTRSFTHPTPTMDLCRSGGSLFARTASPREDGTVQRMSLEGLPEIRFGAMPEGPNAAVRAQLAMGILECSPGGNWVVTATFDGPVLRAYSRTGDSMWTSEVADFTPGQVAVVDVGGASGVQRPGTEPSDRILSLVALSDELLLAQVARIGAPEVVRGRRTWPIERIDSFLMSGTDGQGYYVGSGLPHVIHATASLLVGLVTEPHTGATRVAAYGW